MADDKQKKGSEVSGGFAMLQKLVADSKKENDKKAPAAGTPAPPPPVQTDSVMGLVKSLKDRASYAIFGPPKPEEKK